ncbi:5-(carboxyamino)imidazole ribonucleotide synthase [Aeromicrobium piscarium]|uniref:N5-carboxyaminoimidazole ribonucleotide synthase n=1 Tax=Aeromicrobium piscarium TaxID=2590901 RepID=A0A554SFS9_9ACTN|nr:5-(carboxyamino)imidazole ribonucleotide synthase [Aeromicrobium piscarium]
MSRRSRCRSAAASAAVELAATGLARVIPVPELAVIGGGQLARMMQQPAIALGIDIRLLAEGPDVSAAQVIVDHEVGDYTDLEALRRIAAGADAVTFDHEHVPPAHLRALQDEGVACRPGPQALIYAQDKGDMRLKLDELGVPGPRFRIVEPDAEAPDRLRSFGDEIGWPFIVKTTRGGYDGKGVWRVDAVHDLDDPLSVVRERGARLLAEELVPFTRELSAQIARRPSGDTVSYPVVESRQSDGICVEAIAPAPGLDDELAEAASRIALTVAEGLDVVGMLAVELFETEDGRVLVNEFAMRPHNTGHWSIDGALTSQFENHLRAVLDLPLGSPRPRQPWTVMVNVLGGSVTDLRAQRAIALAAEPDVKIHLYGKSVKPGRKVGHVTAVGDDLDDVLARARRSAAVLTDGGEQ